jgi:hypothetical protein
MPEKKERWNEQHINLAAGVIFNYNSTRPMNAFIIQNLDPAAIIYAGFRTDTSATQYETRVNPGQWSALARPFDFEQLYIFSAAAVNNLKVIEVWTPNPMALVRSNIGGASYDVSVGATVGLTSGELNIEAVTRNLMVKQVYGKTWRQVVAGAAGEQAVKAAPGTVYQVIPEAAITVNIRDGAGNQAWIDTNNEQVFPVGLACLVNIRLNFSAAGTAWILYE